MEVRELEEHEWHRLEECKWLGKSNIPSSRTSRVVVALDDEQLVGFVVAQTVITMEPVWVAESKRGTFVFARMWKKLEDILRDMRVENVMSHTSPTMKGYLKRLGFTATGWELFQKEL